MLDTWVFSPAAGCTLLSNTSRDGDFPSQGPGVARGLGRGSLLTYQRGYLEPQGRAQEQGLGCCSASLTFQTMEGQAGRAREAGSTSASLSGLAPVQSS